MSAAFSKRRRKARRECAMTALKLLRALYLCTYATAAAIVEDIDDARSTSPTSARASEYSNSRLQLVALDGRQAKRVI